MTTARFIQASGAIARLRGQIHAAHCKPDQFAPATAASGSLRCPKCGSSTPYTFSPSGAMQARCSAAGCPVRFDQ